MARPLNTGSTSGGPDGHPFSLGRTTGALQCILPMRGTESEVAGMISATSNMKTVSESSTVMPRGRQEENGNGVWACVHVCVHACVCMCVQVRSNGIQSTGVLGTCFQKYSIHSFSSLSDGILEQSGILSGVITLSCLHQGFLFIW